MEIDEADSHIPTATTTTGMNLILKPGRLRDTHSEGKVKILVNFPCPIKFYESSMADEISRTPHAFKRIWFHSTEVEVKEEIISKGWNPVRIKRTIYGTAVYLSGDKWDLESDLLLSCLHNEFPIDRKTLNSNLRNSKMLGCVLALQANEVQSDFPLQDGSKGNTQDQLIKYLNMNIIEDESEPQRIQRFTRRDNSSTRLQVGKNASPGGSRQNKKIAAYFLRKGIKAIKFVEHDVEVVAVFDPTCIRVLPKTTKLDEVLFRILWRQAWVCVSLNEISAFWSTWRWLSWQKRFYRYVEWFVEYGVLAAEAADANHRKRGPCKS